MSSSLVRAGCPCRVRPLASTRRRLQHSGPARTRAPRTYLYDVDWNGWLYLSESKHRNLATAFRDTRFLDTFFTRLRRNDAEENEAQELRAGGYEFVSPCQGEMNYLRPDQDGSGLVFQALENGELLYGGTMTLPFDPHALRVDAATGRLFHPSPRPTRASRKDALSRYGPFSLLCSSLVVEHFSSSLELDADEGGGGGTFEYEGRRYRIHPLREGDVWRRRGS